MAPSGLSSPNYAITFVPGTLTVVCGLVTVSVSASPAPSGLNQSMMFTANVGAAAPSAGAPGGTVSFFDGAALLGSSTLSSGTASLTTAGLATGTPAGAVLFMVNGQVVGGPVTLTAISGSTAEATFALPGLAGGRHVVTATYLGSSTHKGSTATVAQTVN